MFSYLAAPVVLAVRFAVARVGALPGEGAVAAGQLALQGDAQRQARAVRQPDAGRDGARRGLVPFAVAAGAPEQRAVPTIPSSRAVVRNNPVAGRCW